MSRGYTKSTINPDKSLKLELVKDKYEMDISDITNDYEEDEIDAFNLATSSNSLVFKLSDQWYYRWK